MNKKFRSRWKLSLFNMDKKIHTGKATDEIITLVGQKDFDLIVMASHRITSTLKSIGSTVRKVMDNVKKPILFFRRTV